MAKPLPKPSTDAVEVLVTVMRRIAPERFEVLTGTVKGELANVKVLEKNVSLVVGRGTARKALDAQHRRNAASLGLAVGS